MIEYTDKLGRLVQVEVRQKHADSQKTMTDRGPLEDGLLHLLEHAPASEFITKPTRD